VASWGLAGRAVATGKASSCASRRLARSRPRGATCPCNPCCSGSSTGRWPSFAQAAATGTG
jgi:hypothetical protein